MPYFDIADTYEMEGFVGLAITFGWVPKEQCLQLAITIGHYTIAMGLDFNV